MPLDPSSVGAVSVPARFAWTPTDCILYALGVGAGVEDLAFTTENTRGVDLQVLPTFAVLAGSFVPLLRKAGDIDFTKLVHAGQAVELDSPIPTAGEVESTSRITAVLDKGSGALIETETTSIDVGTQKRLFTTRSSVFIRGAGGFGGSRGEVIRPVDLPTRSPHHVVTVATRRDQALLYRLNGDRNPLHSDPAFAARAGFDRPILHGLCTYGVTGRAVLGHFCGGDPARLRSMSGRFSAPVYPGDELTVHLWDLGDGRGGFRTTATPDGRVVIDAGIVTWSST